MNLQRVMATLAPSTEATAPPAIFALFPLKPLSAIRMSEESALMAPPVASSARLSSKTQLRRGSVVPEWLKEIAPPE